MWRSEYFGSLCKGMILIILFNSFISCRTPSHTLMCKDGKWTMYVNENISYNSGGSEKIYDTLDVEFTSSTEGKIKKANQVDTFHSFTWSYEVNDEFLNPRLKVISIFTLGILSQTSFEVTINKRNREEWKSLDLEYMSGKTIDTKIRLIKQE